MIQENYESIKNWFNGYIAEFNGEDAEVQRNLDLKKDHSLRVCELIKDLGQSLNMIESDLLLAECIALLHDVGRFEQFVQHGTFSDAKGGNHAELGVSIIKEHNVLENLDEEEQEIHLGAISMHNMVKLPKISNKNLLFFTQLLRDADKLDIFRIATDYYTNKKLEPNKSLELELPDKPEISKKVYDNIMAEKTVDLNNVATLNDYKLLQMSWIFDLHLKRSFQIVSEKTYLKRIYETLPKKDEVIDMYRNMRIYMENHL